MQNILFVEDDEDLAHLSERMLVRRGYKVTTAATVATAREEFAEEQPDLLILDIGLPDGDGLTLCEEFKSISDVPVILLTARTGVSDRVAGLQTGADYYLTKPYDREELLAVIENLLRRSQRISGLINNANIITKGTLTLDIANRKASVKDTEIALTPKEFAVLMLLVQHEGEEMSYETIYNKVWQADMNNDTNAVRQTISRMRRKLGDEAELDFSISNEHGKGYVFMS